MLNVSPFLNIGMYLLFYILECISENYGRENLREYGRYKRFYPDLYNARLNFYIFSLYTELHGTGVIKLHEDGTPMINSIGRRVPVYEERHIYTSSKIWTGFSAAYRRG